ncbi:MAG: hypothetical protein NT076_00420, partial [Candidatus Pacearchaeota archaeon]|nr:hypothetical protein [Candidatus Pacearchaeota archaeon]
FVRAAGLYYPDSSNNELIKEVDELGTGKIGNLNPGYILDLGSGKAIYVPEGEIIEKHQPFGETEKKIKEIKDPSAIKLITELERIGVSIKDMGLIGSYLINTGKEPHDVDLIVRGIKNMINIKNNFKELLKKIGAENFPNGDYINSSIQRYNVKYNEEYNDFKGMISRRWPTIYIPKKPF